MNMKLVKKYFPDILILTGVWMFSYVSLFPVIEYSEWVFSTLTQEEINNILIYDYTNYLKLLSIMLLSIGVNIAIRRFIERAK
jgi:hypothetical protein